MLGLSTDGEIPDYYENFVKKSKIGKFSHKIYTKLFNVGINDSMNITVMLECKTRYISLEI